MASVVLLTDTGELEEPLRETGVTGRGLGISLWDGAAGAPLEDGVAGPPLGAEVALAFCGEGGVAAGDMGASLEGGAAGTPLWAGVATIFLGEEGAATGGVEASLGGSGVMTGQVEDSLGDGVAGSALGVGTFFGGEVAGVRQHGLLSPVGTFAIGHHGLGPVW